MKSRNFVYTVFTGNCRNCKQSKCVVAVAMYLKLNVDSFYYSKLAEVMENPENQGTSYQMYYGILNVWDDTHNQAKHFKVTNGHLCVETRDWINPDIDYQTATQEQKRNPSNWSEYTRFDDNLAYITFYKNNGRYPQVDDDIGNIIAEHMYISNMGTNDWLLLRDNTNLTFKVVNKRTKTKEEKEAIKAAKLNKTDN